VCGKLDFPGVVVEFGIIGTRQCVHCTAVPVFCFQKVSPLSMKTFCLMRMSRAVTMALAGHSVQIDEVERKGSSILSTWFMPMLVYNETASQEKKDTFERAKLIFAANLVGARNF
jgi:hypothetical protein